MSNNAYDAVTERVLAMLEGGTAPWRKPWRETDSGGVANLVTGRNYSGVNALLLPALGFPSRFFLTFNQARNLGGHVRAGEKGFPVVFWNFLDREDKDGKARRFPLLKRFTVFNASQCEIPDGKMPQRALVVVPRPDSIPACEAIVRGYLNGPSMAEGGNVACYSPSRDAVTMPPAGAFSTMEHYYSTLFHELGHSTGHASRLNRTMKGGFGSEPYGREELVAEMTAAFLAAETGIDGATIPDSASYLANWIGALRADPKAVVVAAGAAQKAANLILNRSASTADTSTDTQTESEAA